MKKEKKEKEVKEPEVLTEENESIETLSAPDHRPPNPPGKKDTE